MFSFSCLFPQPTLQACPTSLPWRSQVLDEPLYASFLKLTGAERPYLDLVRTQAGALACFANSGGALGSAGILLQRLPAA